MKILHLVSSYRWTGAAEPAADLAQTQRALGHDAVLACIEGRSFWREVERRRIPFIEGLDLRAGPHLFALLSDLRKLRRLVAVENYDVVHCHLQHDHWLAAIALGRLWKGRKADGGPILVRTFHRDVPPRADFLHRRLYGSATDLLITVSRSGRETALHLLRVPDEQVVWIRGAVDLERFHPGISRDVNRALWGIPSDAPTAGIVARMQPHRGHLEFVESISEVVPRVPDAIYIIAGRGERKRFLRAKIAEHPLKDHLKLVGYREYDLAETYSAMDVAVLLAQGSDGTCRAMLEAMACGRPVIGVNVGAVADTIEPGKTGWLVEPNKSHALADALMDALGNLERTAEMGRQARKNMEENFTQRERAEATLAAYEKVIARRKRNP